MIASFAIRGVQVMLESDMTALFHVRVKPMNQQMKRNPVRFPKDFCFRLTKEEILRSQFATSSSTPTISFLPSLGRPIPPFLLIEPHCDREALRYCAKRKEGLQTGAAIHGENTHDTPPNEIVSAP